LSNDNLNDRECYWIKTFNSYLPNGYNMTLGGEGTTHTPREEVYGFWDSGLCVTEIAKTINCHKQSIKNILIQYLNYTPSENIKRTNKFLSKSVYQYDINGNLINTFDSIKDAAESVNIDRSTISKCCSGVKQSGEGYVWSFEPIEFKHKKIKPFEIPVIQLDKNNNPVREYCSASDAARSLGKTSGTHILDVCRGKRQTAFGYKWRCKNE
jgi:hypothetical protein